MYQELATEGKSRYEIIMRAKLSWSEHGARTNQKAFIDHELAEIGMSPLSDSECKMYNIIASARLL